MTEHQQKKTKEPPFGSIAAQTQGLTIGGRTKQQENVPETKTAGTQPVQQGTMSAFQQSIPIDPQEPRLQQTAYLPASLRKWLRIRAPMEERDISDIVTEALLAYRERVESEPQP